MLLFSRNLRMEYTLSWVSITLCFCFVLALFGLVCFSPSFLLDLKRPCFPGSLTLLTSLQKLSHSFIFRQQNLKQKGGFAARIQQISENPSSHFRIGENTRPTSCVSMAHKRREKSEQPDTGICKIKFMSGQDHQGMGQWRGEAWGPFLAYWLDSESPPQDQ